MPVMRNRDRLHPCLIEIVLKSFLKTDESIIAERLTQETKVMIFEDVLSFCRTLIPHFVMVP